MKAAVKIMSIEQIIFESNDQEVIIKGDMQQGVMSFPTDLILNHSQLNHLITVLMKQNEGLNINDILRREKMYNGETLYTAQFTSEMDTKININAFSNQTLLRQIRA